MLILFIDIFFIYKIFLIFVNNIKRNQMVTTLFYIAIAILFLVSLYVLEKNHITPIITRERMPMYRAAETYGGEYKIQRKKYYFFGIFSYWEKEMEKDYSGGWQQVKFFSEKQALEYSLKKKDIFKKRKSNYDNDSVKTYKPLLDEAELRSKKIKSIT